MSQNINTVDISNDANLEDYVLVSLMALYVDLR